MSTIRAVLVVCFGLFIVGASPFDVAAQPKVPFAPPRLWDGKTPDFRGIWQARGTAYVNIEGHVAENGVAASPSIVVDPPDGKIPYTPEALARRAENFLARATADPSLKCYQAGVPRATYLPTPLQILQSPGNFAIVYQENHAFRVFQPDSRPHFDAADFWMGDTRYRWEGDTLVADVVALTDLMWMDHAGNYHSSDVHVDRALPDDRCRYDRVRGPHRGPGGLFAALDAEDRARARHAARCTDRRGRVPRGCERRPPSRLAVRSEKSTPLGLLALAGAGRP